MIKCPQCYTEHQNQPQICFCGYSFIEPPTVAQKAVNLVKAVVKHVSNGMVNVSDSVKEERMNICKSCPFFNSANTTCNQCGCYLEEKTKWASEKCPLDKWSDIKTQASGGCGCNKT